MSYSMQMNDVIRISIFCYDFVNLQVGVNTFYWQMNSGTMLDQTLAAAIAADFAPLYKSVLHNQAAWVGCRISDITPTLRPANQFLGNIGPGNGLMGAPIPDQVSGLVGAHGVYARKGSNARCYIPFPGSLGLTTLGNCSPTYTLYLGSIATAMFYSTTYNVSSQIANFSPLIFHRAQSAPAYPKPNKSKRHPGMLPITAQTIQGVSYAYASPVWANQKRRDQRRRTNPIPTS